MTTNPLNGMSEDALEAMTAKLWDELSSLYDTRDQKELLATMFANSLQYAAVYAMESQDDSEFWPVFLLASYDEMQEVYNRVMPYLDNLPLTYFRDLLWDDGEVIWPVRLKSFEQTRSNYDVQRGKSE